jgi:hypothetical protein
MRSTEKIFEDSKSVTYSHKYHKGDVGDFAFEWDLDGSQQKEWFDKIQQWKEDGTYGQEEEVILTLIKHPDFDKSEYPKPQPMNSYKMIFIDTTK